MSTLDGVGVVFLAAGQRLADTSEAAWGLWTAWFLKADLITEYARAQEVWMIPLLPQILVDSRYF